MVANGPQFPFLACLLQPPPLTPVLAVEESTVDTWQGARGPRAGAEGDLPVFPQDLTGGAFEDNLQSLNLLEGRDFLHFS